MNEDTLKVILTKLDSIDKKIDKLSDELRIVKDQTATLTEFKTTVKAAGEILYKNIS